MKGDNPGNIQKHMLAFFDYIEEHNFLQKALQLQNACYFNPEAAEQLKVMITAGMLATEKGKKKKKYIYIYIYN